MNYLNQTKKYLFLNLISLLTIVLIPKMSGAQSTFVDLVNEKHINLLEKKGDLVMTTLVGFGDYSVQILEKQQSFSSFRTTFSTSFSYSPIQYLGVNIELATSVNSNHPSFLYRDNYRIEGVGLYISPSIGGYIPLINNKRIQLLADNYTGIEFGNFNVKQNYRSGGLIFKEDQSYYQIWNRTAVHLKLLAKHEFQFSIGQSFTKRKSNSDFNYMAWDVYPEYERIEESTQTNKLYGTTNIKIALGLKKITLFQQFNITPNITGSTLQLGLNVNLHELNRNEK